MFALHVQFLTGRYVATAYDDRSEAEWPPHPARLYSALVDALHSDDEVDPEEARALDWLAGLGPPTLFCGEAHPRRIMTSFVPVNDAAVTEEAALTRSEETLDVARAALAALPPAPAAKEKKRAEAAVSKAEGRLVKAIARAASAGGGAAGAGLAVLPWGRVRQPRTFPSVVPTHEVASFAWQADPRDHLHALQSVSSRVARLGHSSSLVAVRPGPVEPDDRGRWEPHPDGHETLRVPLPEQRARLDEAWALHGGATPGRVLPSGSQRYRLAGAEPRGATTGRAGGQWIAYAFDSDRQPPTSAAVAVASSIRAALLHHVGDDAPAMLSGHEAGQVARFPHLAVVPLPFVGHRNADGALRGFALSLPAAASRDDVRALLAAIGQFERAGDGPARRVSVVHGGAPLWATRLVDPDEGLKSLRLHRWEGAATRWASVTPIALDGECDPFAHPKAGVRNKARRTAARLLRKAALRAITGSEGPPCAESDIGIELNFDCPVVGGAPLRAVPVFQRKGHARPRRLVHVVLEFPMPVRGPLLLGAGRHFGLGLMVPLHSSSVSESS